MQTVRLAGFATRAIALAIDLAIVNFGAATTAGIIAFVLNWFGVHEPSSAVKAALGVTGWVAIIALYLMTFWTLTGQTPGMRFMGIRVITRAGAIPNWHISLLRFGGMILAAIPLCAGFLLVTVDDQRRGLHDRLAGTLVVHVGDETLAVPGSSDAGAAAPLPAQRS